eukprot:1993526-Pleurochrysis_carterae.AAC.2
MRASMPAATPKISLACRSKSFRMIANAQKRLWRHGVRARRFVDVRECLQTSCNQSVEVAGTNH